MQVRQGGDLFRRAAIPALPRPLETRCAGLAAGLRRSRANLPATFHELRIIGHVPAFDYVVQQPGGGGPLSTSPLRTPD